MAERQDKILVYYRVEEIVCIKFSPLQLELFMFQQAECNLNFDLHKIVFFFQIYKGIQIIEHTRMKPNKLSPQGSISPSVIYSEDWKHPCVSLTTTHIHINKRWLM